MLGEWWLANPTDDESENAIPDHRVPGEFIDDGKSSPRLTTIGSLSAPGSSDIFLTLSDNKNHRAIWGIDANGDYLSLFDAWRGVSYPLQSGNPGGGTEGWQIGWYASGNAWITRDEPVDRIRIQFDVLDDWTSKSVMVGHDFSMEPGTINLPTAESNEALVNDIEVSLNFGAHVEPSSTGYHARRFSAFDIVDIIRVDKIVSKWISPLKTLLELLTCKPVRVTTVTAAFPDGSHRHVTLHPNILQSTEELDTSRGQLDMLAPLATLQNSGLDFSTLVNNYFSLEATKRSRKHLLAMHQLAHSQSRLLDKSADAELLAAFKAVELFHSAAMGGSDLPRAKHRERIDAIVDNAPDEWQEWARKHLKDKNQKPLIQQLDEVVKRAGKTGVSVLEAWPGFCKVAVGSRNEIAHGKMSEDPDAGLRYHAMSVGLRWVLRHVYLRKLGASQKKAYEIVAASNDFRQEMRTLKSWYGESMGNTD